MGDIRNIYNNYVALSASELSRLLVGDVNANFCV
jgi:hypothetical protein